MTSEINSTLSFLKWADVGYLGQVHGKDTHASFLERDQIASLEMHCVLHHRRYFSDLDKQTSRYNYKPIKIDTNLWQSVGKTGLPERNT